MAYELELLSKELIEYGYEIEEQGGEDGDEVARHRLVLNSSSPYEPPYGDESDATVEYVGDRYVYTDETGIAKTKTHLEMLEFITELMNVGWNDLDADKLPFVDFGN